MTKKSFFVHDLHTDMPEIVHKIHSIFPSSLLNFVHTVNAEHAQDENNIALNCCTCCIKNYAEIEVCKYFK